MKALLLSGGLDSAALAYWLKPQHAITINYGQLPAMAEIRAAAAVAKAISIHHHIIEVDCSLLGSGDLVHKDASRFAPAPEWWPFRNQLIITLAGMKCLQLNISELLVGSIANDSFHKDGTTEFYSRMNALMSYQEGGLTIGAPAINMSSDEIIVKSKIPSSILFWAHSCHKSNTPCGQCRGCYKYASTLKKLYDGGWK